MRRIFIAATGASGLIYTERLINELLAAKKDQVEKIYVAFTESGKKVALFELESTLIADKDMLQLRDLVKNKVPPKLKDRITVFQNDNFFAPIASGTSAPTDMVVVPCSMGTLARISCGISTTLIERAADVMIKERRNLILVPRETPFSQIHLENMLRLARSNVKILPAMPGFYTKPRSLDDLINFVVGKIIEQIGLEHKLYKPWAEEQI